MDDPLTPGDAQKVHSKLTEAAPRAAELGERLGLRTERINNHSQEENQLYNVIVEFLGQPETKPTWRVILEALRSDEVNLPALAKEIEVQIEEEIIPVNQVGTLERYILSHLFLKQ